MQERSLEKRENKSNYKNISRILKRNSNTNSKNKKTQTNTKKKQQHPNPLFFNELLYLKEIHKMTENEICLAINHKCNNRSMCLDAFTVFYIERSGILIFS